MSYVQPNSIIQLMHINGLDNRHLDTIYFANTTAQDTFMTDKVGLTLQKNSYQRIGRGYIKIKMPYDSVATYNYMRFQNTPSNTGTGQARSNKWYYAFIIACEYLNESTTVITYQIDDIQTWFIGATCNPCMIEREHSSTDAYAENLEDEPVGSDAYDNDFIYNDGHIGTTYSLVMTLSGYNTSILDPSGAVHLSDQAGYTEGLFNGTWTCAVTINGGQYGQTDQAIKTHMKEVADDIWESLKGDWNTGSTPIQMLNMIMFPTGYVASSGSIDHAVDPSPIHYTHTFARPTAFDNFTPQNKKMLTYPYCFMYATTGNGDANQLRWEYFDGGHGSNVVLDSYGCSVGEGEIIYVPKNYNGLLENYDSKLSIRNFPHCPFTYDAYQAWIASGGDVKLKTERNFAVASSVVNAATGMLGAGKTVMNDYSSRYTGNYNDYMSSATADRDLNQGALNAVAVGASNYASASTGALSAMGVLSAAPQIMRAVGAGVDIAHTITKVNYQFKDAKYQPRVVIGESTPSTMVGNRLLTFNVYNCHVRDDEAKRIDEFFTMFGYATNRVKTPNFTGRRYWNFVKTNGATIVGDMPANAMANICAILDGGIQFWHGDYIGNYNIGNNGDVITNPII